MSVKAATEKNFRRARVKPGKRRSSKRPVSWRAIRIVVIGVLVTYAVYRACDLVLSASALQVRHISVNGNSKMSVAEVHALADGVRGKSILTADLAAYRRRLLASPWVAEVGLRRVLPSTVEVFISEREPMGLCRLQKQLYLVDRAGVLIDEFGPQYAQFDLPLIDGLVRPPSSGQPAIDERRAEFAARVIDGIAPRKDLARSISQIDVNDLHDAVVLIEGDTALLHLGDDRFLERLQSYVDVAPALRERVQDIDYVDLRFKDHLYVRPVTAAHKRP
ncbi:MAG TPA: FtsQ-type POTRA domain-containing protein [Vicinamibacterales bacterium]|jgi:cell division septal protein FtsQ|nr:FtsQ-type POTRA domain-containing protein [Vicinamibacterales bacterium]